MTWHVQYRRDAVDQIAWLPSPEEAIETACRLIDDGYDVYGIGTGPLTDSIARDEIARIYAILGESEDSKSRAWRLSSFIGAIDKTEHGDAEAVPAL
jgi:hypothetical protein